MWGRRRARGLTEAEQTLEDRIQAAGEAQRELQQAFDRFDEARGQVEAELGHGDGLPVMAVRAQLAEAGELWNWFHEGTALYEEMRRLWTDPDRGDDLSAMRVASEFFSDHCAHCASHVTELDGAINGFLELRDKLLELREKVAPIRERAHTSLAAASSELGQVPATQGTFALTARLNAVSDRLRDLDAGRLEPDPNRKIPDWYRDVETEIADIRDAVPRTAY